MSLPLERFALMPRVLARACSSLYLSDPRHSSVSWLLFVSTILVAFASGREHDQNEHHAVTVVGTRNINGKGFHYLRYFSAEGDG